MHGNSNIKYSAELTFLMGFVVDKFPRARLLMICHIHRGQYQSDIT